MHCRFVCRCRSALGLVLIVLVSGLAAAEPPAGMRTYTQELTVTFPTPADAAAAKFGFTPVLDGRAWAFSARWDDNNNNHIKMQAAMAAEGLEGTFYLNEGTDSRRGRDFGPKYLDKFLKPSFSLGGHTQTHPSLISLAANEMLFEVLANRVEREAQSDRPMNSFAFPFGRYVSNADPRVQANITDVLLRAGFHNTPYKDFVTNNPNLKGEFSTSHQVVPGDHDVDAEKFDAQVDKVLKQKASNQKVSACISLGVHAQQSAAAWPKLAELYTKYGHRADWWYCTMNEYAAYDRQVRFTQLEVSGDGATRTLKFTRPIAADLGDDVPLTLAIDGNATSVKATGFEATQSKQGDRTLVNLAHADTSRGPTKIDAIDNVDNAPTRPADRKLADFPDLAAWLTFDPAARSLKLALENNGRSPIAEPRLTLRLPLKFTAGVQHPEIAALAAGEKRTLTLPLGEQRPDATLDEGRFYAVAELDFRHDGQTCRLYATVRAAAGQTTPAIGLRDAAYMAGPLDVASLDLAGMSAVGAPLGKLGDNAWYTAEPSDRLRFSSERATLYSNDTNWKTAAQKFNNKSPWGYVVAAEFELSEATTLELKTEGKPTAVLLNGKPADAKKMDGAVAGRNRVAIAFNITDGRSTWEPFPVLIRLLPAAGKLTYIAADPKLLGTTPAPAKPTELLTPAAGAMAPFVIPAKLAEGSPIALKNRPISGEADRIVSRDGHFYRGSERFRVWGVNFAYATNFPTHEAADALAARLESFGFNAVRIHHIDAYTFPSGIWDKSDPTRFSEEALDRLDYLVDALAKRGIYCNLNLHVSRTYNQQLGLPDTKKISNYSKVVDLFTPQLIAAEQDYARQLLGRTNRYRKLSYAADPAIAFIEINNENSLFAYDWDERLAALPEPFAGMLKSQFNDYLKKRFSNTEAIAAAWKAEALTPPAPVALPFADKAWQLGVTSPAKASMTPLKDADGARIEPHQAGSAAWHLQLNRAGLAVRPEFEYVLSFRARADAPRSLLVRLTQSGGAFKILSRPANVSLTIGWKDYALTFSSTAVEDQARVSIVMGGALVPWEMADVKFSARPVQGLRDGETLGSIAFTVDGESPARRTDRMMFLAETEKAYWDGFGTLIRDELKSPALLTGTMVYGAANLWAQSSMDFIDNHAYWSHPKFPPGKGFNLSEWTVDQAAMVDVPNESPLLRLAISRIAGRPFTVSEYNHAAPGDTQAECVPMIAAFAAAQDWDGVWFFCYSQKAAEMPGVFNNWFEIDQNPAKMGFMQAGALIFRDGGMAPLKASVVNKLPAGLAELCMQQNRSGMEVGVVNVARDAAVTQRFGTSLGDAAGFPPINDSSTEIQWTPGSFHASGDRARVIVQTMAANAPLKSANRFAAVTAVALDGQPLEKSKRLLLTAVGKVENTEMGFSPDRRTLGRNWGRAPTLIEPIAGTITIPWTDAARLQPLSPAGEPGGTTPVMPVNGELPVPLTADAGTMWYLLTR